MTIYTSQMISGMVGQQVGMFSGYGGYAQQINPMMQQPMMPQMGAMGAMRSGNAGIYGEQAAMRMANVGQTAMGVGAAGLGVMAAFSPVPLDPFSGAMMGARFGLGGAAMGAAGGAVAALPLFAATQAAKVYGGAFTGGMQDQAALNSTLRNNFQHMGGQGAFGRGFDQRQMGQVGQMISGELRRNSTTTSGELNSVIAGGAEAGMFTAVRDVQQFTQKFKQMLNTLKDVQRELGGTLTDALQFVRSSQQAGIYQNADRVNFAAEVRGAEAVTGMDRQQLVALSAMGSQISRGTGGVGRQGAFGALRAAQALGSAVQSGSINQEMLSEATGGLQGAEAIQSFSMRMLQHSERFSRRGMGRFSLFALSNENGTGLDQDMLARFQAGDLTTGDVSSRAHRNVGRMGRARALNREGMLRGAMIEQGGMAGQIGMMRLMVGDRVMDQSDDMASLVMQRRFRMSRPESELMMSLMRNQGSIAEQQSMDRQGASRSTAIQRDITENRSVDAFMRNLGHGMQNEFGVTKAREMGRSFMTRLSSLAERAMNDILGSTASSLNQGDQRAINRLMTGRLGESDADRITVGARSGGTGAMFGERPAAQQILHSLGLSHTQTNAEAMEARGVHNFRRMDATAAREVMQSAMEARTGFVTGRDREQLQSLNADSSATMRRIQMAQVMASGSGDPSAFYRFMGEGTSANSVDAFMSGRGMVNNGAGVDRAGMLMAGRGGRISPGMVARDVLTGVLGGPAALLARGLFSGGTGLETLDSVTDRRENDVTNFIASGGHARREHLATAGRTSARDANELIEQGGRGIMQQILGSDGRRSTAANQARSALIAAGMEGVSGDDVRTVLGGEGVRSRLTRMSGLTNRDELNEQMGMLRTEIGRLEDPGQARAGRSILTQLERNISRNGRIGSEFRPGLNEADRRRESELTLEYQERAAGLRGLSRRLEDAGGGEVASLFNSAAGRMTSFSDGITREDLLGASGDIASARSTLSRMDPNSEQYRRMSRALGQDDQGQAILAGVAQERQQRRALSGQGRRGRAQAVETAFGMVTGGSLSEMEFTVGGRTISGGSRNAARQLAAAMSRGGEEGGQVMSQLRRQLEERGVSETDSGNLVGTLSQGIMFGEGRGLSGGSIEDLIRQTGTGESGAALQRIQQQGVERQQRSRDPLGVQRNELLTQMNRTLSDLHSTVRERGGVPTGEGT